MSEFRDFLICLQTKIVNFLKSHKYFCYLLKYPLTSLLLPVFVILIFSAVFFRVMPNQYMSGVINGVPENNIQSGSVFPDNTDSDGESDEEEQDKAYIKSRKDNTETKNNSLDISSGETKEGRNKDRIIIGDLIADIISEYLFEKGKLPLLYNNKSKKEISNTPTKIIYFYNGDENKINAKAFTLGNNPDLYSYVRIDKCTETLVNSKLVHFIYTSTDIHVCLEGGGSERFWIVN